MEIKKMQIKNILIQDLKQAQQIASHFTSGYSDSFSSAETFQQAFSETISRFENGDDSAIEDLWLWFTPTSCWDNFVGEANLGNRIFERLKELKKSSF